MIPTPAACLIGWPAAHSRSPLIHKYWLKELGLDGDYRIEPVEPAAFAGFVAQFRAKGYIGANVTIPHKERALGVSSPDDRAYAIGAANTLYFEGGELRSTNTDVEGFIDNLDASAPGWDAIEDALVLGAGGSARAVIFGLLERGVARVYLANRTIDRANDLANQFGERVVVIDNERIGDVLPRAGLLVNTTSLGMTGQPPLVIDLSLFSSGATVADLVYVPLETPLLKAAKARGLKTADGLGMLLHQAVRGFELWFGVRPKVTQELHALIEADLKSA